MNAVLLKPVAFREPDRLAWIANVSDNGVDEWRLEVFSYLDVKNCSRTDGDMAGCYGYYGDYGARWRERKPCRRPVDALSQRLPGR